jgi:multiple sugar transport system substrate-binding protein
MRKRIVLITLIIFALMLSAGYSQAAKKKKTPKIKPVTVKLVITGDTKRKAFYDRIFQELKEKKGITVEILLSTSTEMTSKIATQIAAGTAPDLAWFFDKNLEQYINTKNLEDISILKKDPEFNLKDIYPSTIVPCMKKGKLYAVPFTAGARVIYFNKDLFRAKGLPDPLTLYKEGKWTWDKMFELAKQLTDKSKGIYGLSLVNYSDPKDWRVIYDFLWSQGADFFNKKMTKVVIDSPQGIKALQRYSDLFFVDQCHVKPGDQVMFESGQIAMCRNQFSYTGNLQKVDFDWDIAPHPAGPVKNAPVVTGIAAYAVVKGTKHKKAAIEAVKFITDYERQKALVKIFPPTRKSVLESDVFLKASAQKPSPAGRQAASIDSMKNLRLFPMHPNLTAVNNKMRELMDLLYTRAASIKTIVKRMKTEINPLLK